jgi:hypothetical protein
MCKTVPAKVGAVFVLMIIDYKQSESQPDWVGFRFVRV